MTNPVPIPAPVPVRRYTATFWQPTVNVWPVIEERLKTAGAVFKVTGKGFDTVVVECPEETALLLRDDVTVQSLLIARP